MSEVKNSYLDSVYKCIAEVRYKEATELGKKAIEIGVSPDELASALTKGMTEIGAKYEARKIGLPHLFLAVKCVKEILTP
ncbi:MAG: B12-binding domain-containing protein, partial [Fervidobacterium sp.]